MYRDINKYLRPNSYPVQVLGKETQINIILQETDFEKIHRVMVALNWIWVSSLTGIPSIEEMIFKAKRDLETIWDFPETDDSQIYFTGSGGFMAYKFVIDGLKMLSLKFEITGWEFDYYDVQNVDYN